MTFWLVNWRCLSAPLYGFWVFMNCSTVTIFSVLSTHLTIYNDKLERHGICIYSTINMLWQYTHIVFIKRVRWNKIIIQKKFENSPNREFLITYQTKTLHKFLLYLKLCYQRIYCTPSLKNVWNIIHFWRHVFSQPEDTIIKEAYLIVI